MSIPAAWKSACRCKLDQRHGLHARAASGLRPYSGEIRERALACAGAHETVRSIAQALQISPSCVTKSKKLRRETGGVRLELAARGIKTDVWAVWTFVHAEELSFKKTIEPAEQDRRL